MKVFSIYDSKAVAWTQPFYSMNAATAIRTFEQIVNEDGHAFNMHPEDYTLFELGEWHEQEGKLVVHESKMALGVALEFKTNPAPIHAVQGDRG